MSEWIIRIVSGLLLFIYFVLVVQTIRRKGSRGFREFRGFRWLIEPFTPIIQYRPLLERIEPTIQRQRVALAILNGGECRRELLWSWVAESIGLAYLIVFLSSLLAMMAGEAVILVMGFFIACCLPLQRTRELNNKVSQHRQLILMELPELLSRLLLMVNAGDQVLHAIARCADENNTEHPLYLELRRAIEGIKRGESLSYALEEMGRRCAVPEVRLFATTVLINARRGGEAFVPALRELTRQMWDKRKAMARMLGEQASSKLAFPLAVIFLLIMVLVGAPTMLMM